MTTKAPGKHHRKGITLLELTEMFPDENSARVWFEAQVWTGQRCCGHCGSTNTAEATHKTMPYRCRDCRKYFSVKTGTALAASNVPLRKWVFAIYLELTNLKGVSSMKLHRDLGVTQKTAWFMLHRIRESWAECEAGPFTGPVEADETYVGGKAKNMHASQRAKLTGRGGADKTAVVGVKDRDSGKVTARVVASTDAGTLVPFVEGATMPDALVFTDGATAYSGLARDHETVAHSVGEYVRGQAHTNGIESFWAMLKRGYQGVYHNLSPKHLHRYVNEYAGRHNFREMDTIDQMRATVRGLIGQRVRYCDLVAAGPAGTVSEPW
ncbi:IS1595 family transposase [Candidatus Poriferisodalis sp.]|uniref:IS1595 family transposase n=1 Tax=Candidatus Poriferisodalis sp. TaxID=3101277 RepID=UPI003B5CB132